jgi:hypothetical protein
MTRYRLCPVVRQGTLTRARAMVMQSNLDFQTIQGIELCCNMKSESFVRSRRCTNDDESTITNAVHTLHNDINIRVEQANHREKKEGEAQGRGATRRGKRPEPQNCLFCPSHERSKHRHRMRMTSQSKSNEVDTTPLIDTN